MFSEAFWFTPSTLTGSLRSVRIGLSFIAAWYFASHWMDVSTWFSSDGILSPNTLREFLNAGDLDSEAQWRWSPLYLTGSTLVLRIYLIIGVILAGFVAFARISSRLPSVLLWLWCVWLANRSLLIAGPEELALCMGLAYIAIASPKDSAKPIIPAEPFSLQVSWCTALSHRLIQVHTSMLFVGTSLMMLASTIWWDGTGSISVAAPTGRRWIDLTGVLESPWLYEPLTHAIVLVALVCPLTIWAMNYRYFSLISLFLWCLVMMALSSQTMYLATLIVLLQSFATPPLLKSLHLHSGSTASQ